MHKGLLFNVVCKPHDSRSVGVYRIAHYLREKNLDIEVIDWANYWQLEQLKELFLSRYNSSMKFIGFSFLFSQWPDVLEDFCAWVKLKFPNIKIIAGGSSNPKFNSKHIDYFVRGFGEYAAEVLLKYILGNGSAPSFSLTAPNGKKIIDAIHSYPAFPMESLMVKYQDRDFVEPHEWLTVEFARGCMFSCKFCHFPILGVKDDTSRSAEDFTAQLTDAYDRFGITNYLVADETFNDRPKKLVKFADAVQTLPFTPWFSGFIRPDLIVSRPDDREQLLRMNFLGHFHGIESFNHASAKSVGKGMETEKLLNGLLDLKKFFTTHGSKKYQATLSIMVGLPFDTLDNVMFTKKWLLDNWQTQSFASFPLGIPVNEMDNKSTFSLEYKKYGYRDMSQETYEQCIAKWPNVAYADRSNVFWENDHMNYFQADEYANDLASIKYDDQNFFAPGVFHLASKLKNSAGLDEKLKLNAKDFRNLLDDRPSVLDSYIQKKLNYQG